MNFFSKLSFSVLIAALGLSSFWANAQSTPPHYPNKPIKFIGPATPGGAIDILAWVIAEKLTVASGQPVVVDNKPGASNNLGTDIIAKSAPDGYPIGIVGGSHNINKFLFKDVGWDPEKSFEPIVYKPIPDKTLPELVAWMKANPDNAIVATTGRGSAQKMASEMFKSASGVEFLLVPYKGSTAAYPDMRAKL